MVTVARYVTHTYIYTYIYNVYIYTYIYNVTTEGFRIDGRICWSFWYSAWLHFTVHYYTHTHARELAHTRICHVLLPLLGSGFQRHFVRRSGPSRKNIACWELSCRCLYSLVRLLMPSVQNLSWMSVQADKWSLHRRSSELTATRRWAEVTLTFCELKKSKIKKQAA
jgi:hypothetical protein